MAVNHVVFFKFKEGVSQDGIKQHMSMFRQLSETIPGITGYSAGKTFGVDYEPTADYDCMHCVICESEAALEAYYFNDKHKEFIERNKHLWEDVLVLNADVEV